MQSQYETKFGPINEKEPVQDPNETAPNHCDSQIISWFDEIFILISSTSDNTVAPTTLLRVVRVSPSLKFRNREQIPTMNAQLKIVLTKMATHILAQ